MLTEEWRPVAGYVGIYEVSSIGRIRRLPEPRRALRVRVLKPRYDKKGYVRVALHHSGRKDAAVHRLVALAFLGAPPGDKVQVNHIDGDKQNNAVTNLEWVTGAENIQHSYDLGIRQALRGEAHARRKLNWAAVNEIRASALSQKVLSQKYGVSASHIGYIRHGKSWREDQRPRDLADGTIAATLARIAKPRAEVAP